MQELIVAFKWVRTRKKFKTNDLIYKLNHFVLQYKFTNLRDIFLK